MCFRFGEIVCIAIRWIRTTHVDRMRCNVDELLVALQNDALIVCNRASVFHGCIAPRATNIYPSLLCDRTAKKEKEEMYVARKPRSHTHMHTNTLKWMEIDEKKDFKLIDNSWQSHIGLSESFIKFGPQMIRYCFVCALRAYENSIDSSFVSRDLKLMIFWAIGLSSVRESLFSVLCMCVWLRWLMCQIAWIIRFN